MAKPWRVLLMVRELGGGGCERDLTKIALGLDRTRFEPHVGCFRREGLRARELAEAGVAVTEFAVRSFVSRSAIAGGWQMGRYIRRHAIDLVHCFDCPTDLFGVPVARAFGTRAVVASELWQRKMVAPRWQVYALRLTDRIADAVVVNSGAVRRELVEQEKLRPGRTFLSYNGVDTRVFHPADEPRPAALAGAELVVGTVCMLRPEKRLPLLLRAFAAVFGGRPGVRLVIAGDGEMLDDLRALAEELGIAKQCLFTGAQADVAPWMRAIDIFVLTSSSESFPNALLEAMACGCACVASRVGGTPELIKDGENGLLFHADDEAGLAATLRVLAEDPERRARLGGEAARTAREEFGVERAVGRIERIYAGLLDGSMF